MTTTRTTSAVERVGFVGLGIMGLPMARNLLKAGFPLAVTNRTIARAEPLRAEGATLCRTPKEVAERSDVLITIVTSSPDVEAVTFGPDGIADGAHDGLLAVDMSTISPDVTRDIARRAGERGFRTVDAPVSGGEVGAIEARLSIMIGGDDADVARAMPLFRAMGKTIVHMGPHGAGQATKLANQIAVALNNLDGDFAPGFMVDLQQKDLRLVLDAAYASRTPLPGTSLAHELYTALQHAGEGRLGNHALIKAIEALAGTEARAKKV